MHEDKSIGSTWRQNDPMAGKTWLQPNWTKTHWKYTLCMGSKTWHRKCPSQGGWVGQTWVPGQRRVVEKKLAVPISTPPRYQTFLGQIPHLGFGLWTRVLWLSFLESCEPPEIVRAMAHLAQKSVQSFNPILRRVCYAKLVKICSCSKRKYFRHPNSFVYSSLALRTLPSDNQLSHVACFQRANVKSNW